MPAFHISSSFVAWSRHEMPMIMQWRWKNPSVHMFAIMAVLLHVSRRVCIQAYIGPTRVEQLSTQAMLCDNANELAVCPTSN